MLTETLWAEWPALSEWSCIPKNLRWVRTKASEGWIVLQLFVLETLWQFNPRVQYSIVVVRFSRGNLSQRWEFVSQFSRRMDQDRQVLWANPQLLILINQLDKWDLVAVAFTIQTIRFRLGHVLTFMMIFLSVSLKNVSSGWIFAGLVFSRDKRGRWYRKFYIGAYPAFCCVYDHQSRRHFSKL